MSKMCFELLESADLTRLFSELNAIAKKLTCIMKIRININDDVIMIKAYCLRFWKKNVIEDIVIKVAPVEVIKC